MDSLFRSLAANAPQAIFVLLVVTAILAAGMILQAKKIRRYQSRWKELIDGTKGENLERLLYDHLRERMQLQTQIDTLSERASVLEEKASGSKRHLGLVKYDAFEDVGGNQSFALAIYDDRGDGALITSLIGRTDCRVYCKPLLAGKSERNLSQEEQRAIQEALQKGPKSIVSH